MKSYAFCFILGLFLCLSCSSDKKNSETNIHLEKAMGNERVVKLSELGSQIKYIQLETNDSSLVGDISVPFYFNGYFYIIDAARSVCKIFDKQGNYIGNLGSQGRGRGEFTGLGSQSLSFDEETKHIFVYCGRKIIEYSPIGKFINEITLPAFPEAVFNVYKIVRFKDVYAVSIGDKEKNDLIYLDKAGNLLGTIPEHYSHTDTYREEVSSNSGTVLLYLPSYILLTGDEIRVFNPGNDTVFAVNPSLQKKIAYILDMGKYKVPASCTDMAERMKYIQLQVLKTVETPEYIFLTFMFGENAPAGITPPLVRGIFSKKTGDLQLLKRPEPDKDGLLNDIDHRNTFWPTYYSREGYLIMPVASANEYDNPALMMVKLP